jgi:hypothetical protein
MSDIRNITLSFPCQEKLERNAAGEFYCHKCAHAITDFRCQSAEALQEAIRQAGTRPVCGIFKSSQLSEKFARYAAAAAIVVTGASATMCSTEALAPNVPPENDLPVPNVNEISLDSMEYDTVFTTTVTAGIIMIDPDTTGMEESIRQLNETVSSQDDEHR